MPHGYKSTGFTLASYIDQVNCGRLIHPEGNDKAREWFAVTSYIPNTLYYIAKLISHSKIIGHIVAT